MTQVKTPTRDKLLVIQLGIKVNGNIILALLPNRGV